jgi:hypothetical protein
MLVKVGLTRLEIRDSPRKHGIADSDIRHAFVNAIRLVDQEYDGEARVLLIGPDRSGRLLELVAVAGPVIIHADVLRPRFYVYLGEG